MRKKNDSAVISEDIIKSAREIEKMFELIVLTILGLDPANEENGGRVRFPWGSNIDSSSNSSAPAPSKNEDVCYIYALPVDDPYSRMRDTTYKDYGGKDLTEIEEHSEAHLINFVNYGPGAYEYARDIRDGLFCHHVTRILENHNFTLIPDVPAIVRIPELINTEWYNRVDVSAKFYEYVRRVYSVKTFDKVPLTVSTKSDSGKMIQRNDTIKERKGK